MTTPKDDENLTLTERVRLCELALSEIQNTKHVGYLGLCVNAALARVEPGHGDEPHWDDYHKKLARKIKC